MNKLFWIGLSVFILGVIAVGLSLFFSYHSPDTKSSDVSFYSLIPSFLLPSASPITSVPTPAEQETKIAPLTSMTLYYDLDCSYCHELTNMSLLPFLTKYAQKFDFSIVPFSKNTVEKDQNESLLLYCLLQTEKPILVLEKTKDMQKDWKEWRDTQPNAEDLKKCMNTPETYPLLQAMREQAKAIGIRGTPTLVVDNEKWEGLLSPESLITILAEYIQ